MHQNLMIIIITQLQTMKINLFLIHQQQNIHIITVLHQANLFMIQVLQLLMEVQLNHKY